MGTADDAYNARRRAAYIKKPKSDTKFNHAEYMREYRKRKAADVRNVKDDTPHAASDAALADVIQKRGRILDQMMNTPYCMWDPQWSEEGF